MPAAQYQPSNKEKDFLQYHTTLRNELNNANWHFAVWKCLHKLDKDYSREMDIAPAFFALTMRAHLVETTMRLCRCLDRRNDTVDIYSFLDYAEAHREMFYKRALRRRIEGEYAERMVERTLQRHTSMTPTRISKLKERIAKLPIENLRRQRNKAFAHIAREVTLEGIDVFEKYPVKVGEIETIISTLDEVLNELSNAYNTCTCAKELYGSSLEHSIQEILDSIRFKRQASCRTSGRLALHPS